MNALYIVAVIIPVLVLVLAILWVVKWAEGRSARAGASDQDDLEPPSQMQG